MTTLARDLDPAVERGILRCLQHQARQRPVSALAVAAALPGGDPLAAAIAAGQTPSPELAAAAGATEGLSPRVAMAWMGAAVVLLLTTILAGSRVAITSKMNLENSPDALSRDARTHIRSFGYLAKPADTAWGMEYNEDYKSWARNHSREANERWSKPADGQPPLVKFWYRESPRPMFAVRRYNVAINFNDPPMEQSGLIRLETDPEGKLIRFDAVPALVENTSGPAAPFDWNKLF